jgi:hypothetical protein
MSVHQFLIMKDPIAQVRTPGPSHERPHYTGPRHEVPYTIILESPPGSHHEVPIQQPMF